MKISWKIQKVNFYNGQFEEKGQIDMENAVKEFTGFPWEEQLEERERRLRSSVIFSAPGITFKSGQGQLLHIWTDNIDFFNIHYKNKSKHAELKSYNDPEQDLHSLAAEEYIRYFFRGELEDHIELEETKASTIIETGEAVPEKTEYTIVGSGKLRFLSWSFIWLVINFFTILWFNNVGLIEAKMGTVIFTQLLFLISWAPGIHLYLGYSARNAGAKLIVNHSTQTIEYHDNKASLIFSKDDIEHCRLRSTRNEPLPWRSFKNLRIDLKDGRTIWITSLLADTSEVIKMLNLPCKRVKTFIPEL